MQSSYLSTGIIIGVIYTALDTNLKGAFLMAKAALPALRLSKGTIVNVASYVGLVGFAGASAYAASKAGLVSLTRTMALDHAAESIRVNCVCPGSVETDMIYEAWEAYEDTEAARRAWEAKHPLGRIGTPEEIAHSPRGLAPPEFDQMMKICHNRPMRPVHSFIYQLSDQRPGEPR